MLLVIGRGLALSRPYSITQCIIEYDEYAKVDIVSRVSPLERKHCYIRGGWFKTMLK